MVFLMNIIHQNYILFGFQSFWKWNDFKEKKNDA